MTELHQNIRRILIFRALYLGDLLCAVPAWRALRRAFPQASITLLGLSWAKEFASRFHHYLDAFIEFPGYPGLPEQTCSINDVPDFMRYVQSQKFDLALQMHGNGTITNPLLTLLGATKSAGFFRPDAYCPDKTLFLAYPEDEPEVWRHLKLVQRLGIPLCGDELEFPIYDSDLETANQLPEYERIKSEEFACLHPGARSVERRWSAERFAAVADELADLGLKIILTGTQTERSLCEEVQNFMREPSINLAGRTSLGCLAAVLKNARLLISNDTGVSHLAAALRVPSVIIAGFDTPRWAPSNTVMHRVVYDPLMPPWMRTLRSLRRTDDGVRPSSEKDWQPALDRITVDAVMEQVEHVMQEKQSPVAVKL